MLIKSETQLTAMKTRYITYEMHKHIRDVRTNRHTTPWENNCRMCDIIGCSIVDPQWLELARRIISKQSVVNFHTLSSDTGFLSAFHNLLYNFTISDT